jgi:hypothetical protein
MQAFLSRSVKCSLLFDFKQDQNSPETFNKNPPFRENIVIVSRALRTGRHGENSGHIFAVFFFNSNTLKISVSL